MLLTDRAPSPNKKKQKTDSTRPKNYRKFDECSKTIQDGVLASCSQSYLQHLEENDGKCERSFIKILVDQATETAPSLGITRDDIKN